MCNIGIVYCIMYIVHCTLHNVYTSVYWVHLHNSTAVCNTVSVRNVSECTVYSVQYMQ